MPRFSKEYQESHDIDWFAKIGNMNIHAMSFGGLLPNEVNDRDVNTRILLDTYRMGPLTNELEYNDEYINERIRSNESLENQEEGRERYLKHFKEMAIKGFYSFDRDLHLNNVYHLIVKPARNVENMNEINQLPEINSGIIKGANEKNILLIFPTIEYNQKTTY